MRDTNRRLPPVAIVALLLVGANGLGSTVATGAVAGDEKKVQPVVEVRPAPEIEVIAEPLAPAALMEPWTILEREPGEADVEYIEQMIQAFRLARLVEELHLEEEEAARMAVRMREVEEKRKQIDAIRDSILPKIREEIDVSEKVRRKIDEARLQYLIAKMQERTAQHQMELHKLEERMHEALSVEQRARMLLFQKEFQQEMQQMLQMAREARIRHPRSPRAPKAIVPPKWVPGELLVEPEDPEVEEPEGDAPEPEDSDSR